MEKMNRAGYCSKIFYTDTDTLTSIPVPDNTFFDTNFYLHYLKNNNKKKIVGVNEEFKSYFLSYVAWCYSVHECSRNAHFRLCRMDGDLFWNASMDEEDRFHF